MKEYSYDEESVKALCDWAVHATFPKEADLNEAEHIFDVDRYVQATRLYLLKDIMEGKDTE